MARNAILLFGVLTVATWAGVVGARAQSATTNDGIYTAEQATQGKELYERVCASCHEPAKFTGAEFTRAYGGRPLSELDGAMAEMPYDDPGSLSREEVASLIAYFLQMNKYPAGKAPLDGDAANLKSIMVAPRQ